MLMHENHMLNLLNGKRGTENNTKLFFSYFSTKTSVVTPNDVTQHTFYRRNVENYL